MRRLAVLTPCQIRNRVRQFRDVVIGAPGSKYCKSAERVSRDYAMLQKVTLTGNQTAEIQEFYDSMRDRVVIVSFEEKLQLPVLYDDRGKLTV
jgi:hypothetical protein